MLIGVDIGGTKCAVSAAERKNDSLEIFYKKSFPTPTGDPDAALTGITDLIHGATREKSEKIEAIGISCGNPLDAERGIILSPPNLPGWDEIFVTEYFEERFSAPARLENDANACAVAEWKFGAGRGYDNMIFITFGTGMGAGLIINGSLYRGACGNAGEIGHIRLDSDGPEGYGKRGSFEGFCSGGGIARFACEYIKKLRADGKKVDFCGKPENVTAKIISEAAKRGDDIAKEIFSLCGERLGQGLAILVDIINPEAIVIGSIFTRSRELLWESCERVLKRECLPDSLAAVNILKAGLGENIGDYAALSLAAQINDK